MFREVLNGFEARTFVCGEMKKGAVLGNHYHKRTRVFFYLTRGAAQVATLNVATGETDPFRLNGNQGIFFEVNESHAVRFTDRIRVRDAEIPPLRSCRPRHVLAPP